LKRERIKEEIVEDNWDSIAAANTELPMPEWQKRELDKRYKEYEEGKLGLHDWKSVHEDLIQEYK
jgi:putative addiction module component (TIGR02574 family)